MPVLNEITYKNSGIQNKIQKSDKILKLLKVVVLEVLAGCANTNMKL